MTANRRTTVLIVSAVVLTMLAGGLAFAQQTTFAGQTSPAQTMGMSGTAGTVTMADIDNALATGPVFVEFETKECGYCKQQRPISEALANDYAGKVTFFFVDATQSRDLANAFQVRGVPQIDVIAQKSDAQYTYVGKDGTASTSIPASRFVGLTQSDELKTALDAAVRMRGQ